MTSKQPDKFIRFVVLLINLLTYQLINSTPVWATHGAREAGIPLTNAETALSLLYANPPLPMTFFKPGDYKMTVLVDFFSVQKPAQSSEVRQPVTDVSLDSPIFGWGGGVLLEKAFSSRWSLYGMALGARLGKGTLDGRANAKNRDAILSGASTKPGQIFQHGESDGSTSLGASLGVNIRIWGTSPEKFSLSGFMGPTLFHTKGTGTTVILDLDSGSAPTSNLCAEDGVYPGGYKCVKRTYEASETFVSPTLGLQAGIPIRNFTFNPYIITFLATPDDNDPALLLDPPFVGSNGTTQEVPYFRAISPLAIGANLTYRPWGLTVNLTGSLAAPFIAAQAEIENFKMLKFQVSKSFGNYTK